MAALEGVSDPETKRKAIGEKFIEVFDQEAKKHTDVSFPGTRYTLYRCDRVCFCERPIKNHQISS